VAAPNEAGLLAGGSDPALFPPIQICSQIWVHLLEAPLKTLLEALLEAPL